MTEPDVPAIERSYGCSYACGNPYDVVFIQVQDGTTEFLCYPCFVKLASEVADAIINPDNPISTTAMREAIFGGAEAAPGPKGKRRGHNAPANTVDDGVIAAFDSVVTVDELPEEFK